MRRSYLRRKGKSPRAKLYRELDKIFFKLLKHKRGETCEISGRPANGLGTFHILSKATAPRLRYSEQNCLLVNWLPYHYAHHQHNEGHKLYDECIARIKELRGEDYIEKLKMLNSLADHHNTNYLSLLLLAMQQELNES